MFSTANWGINVLLYALADYLQDQLLKSSFSPRLLKALDFFSLRVK